MILAAISIATLTGDNGILTKANIAKKDTIMKKAEEEMKMVLNEWQIEKATGKKDFVSFLNEKVKKNEIDSYDLQDDDKIQINKDGYCMVVDSNGKIIGEIQKLKYKTEATYKIISTEGENLTISITIKNQDGIQKVVCPNGDIITTNHETEITIENYKVANHENLEFIIQAQDEEEIFHLNASEENTITILGTGGAYPILTKSGVQNVGAIITIQNSQNEACYYSLDNGNTWFIYTKEFMVNTEGTIMVKKSRDNEIVRIEQQEVVLNLANDAIKDKAYDKNADTYETSLGYMYLSDEVKGENLYVDITSSGSYSESWWGNSYVCFYDANNKELESERYVIGRASRYTGNVKIPEEAVKCGISHSGAYTVTYCYSLDFSTMPTFDEVQLYPYIAPSGVCRDKKYKIKYYETAVKKLYCKDNVNWEDYPEEGVELTKGETIYAKSINSDGEESQILVYKHNLNGIVGDEAYDGDILSAFDCNGNYKYYIYIDPNVQGKQVYLKFTARKYSEWHFNFLDDKGNQTDTWPAVVAPYNEGYQDGLLTIPENVAKLEIVYTGGNGGPGTFYEIELKK